MSRITIAAVAPQEGHRRHPSPHLRAVGGVGAALDRRFGNVTAASAKRTTASDLRTPPTTES
ncbi:hypothetical protein D4764_01G0020680 [Takifugu flavidus]|uniref:Uncharacterized protein n=1 Tax=Takifugu flavidus TaxID=433684 RepID=A0A5C6PS07_9TELE|nr:hypothetical protein D4764_01G0020680 [Takifugu flavidus]